MGRTGRVGRGQALHPRAGPGVAGLGPGLRGAPGSGRGQTRKQGATNRGGIAPREGRCWGCCAALPDRVSLPPDLRRQKKQLRPPRGRRLGSGSALCGGQGKCVPGQGPSHPGVCAGDTQARRERLVSWKPGTPRFQDQGHQVNHGKVRSSPSRRSALLDSNRPVSQQWSLGCGRAEVSVNRSCTPPEGALQRTGVVSDSAHVPRTAYLQFIAATSLMYSAQ